VIVAQISFNKNINLEWVIVLFDTVAFGFRNIWAFSRIVGLTTS
jgi:hypothetical protein